MDLLGLNVHQQHSTHFESEQVLEELPPCRAPGDSSGHLGALGLGDIGSPVSLNQEVSAEMDGHGLTVDVDPIAPRRLSIEYGISASLQYLTRFLLPAGTDRTMIAHASAGSSSLPKQ